MVVMMACKCDEGLGLPHSHVEAQVLMKNKTNDRTYLVPKSALELNPVETYRILGVEPESIKIWIDWREFGMSLLRDGC